MASVDSLDVRGSLARRIGFVCTNYNGTSDTLTALKGLLADGGDGVCAVVVDNCSRTEERERLVAETRQEPRVHVLLSDENLGYFAGLNAGIGRLRELWPDCEIMAIGNNDLEFPPGFCRSVVSLSSKLEQYPVISPRIQTRDGREQNPHVVHSVSFVRECFYDAYHLSYSGALLMQFVLRMVGRRIERGDEAGYLVEQPVWQGHGACFLIGPLFLREFSSLWAPTFLFGEEFFLSLQLQRKGFQVLYDPAVRVVHACHASVGSLPGRRQWEFSRLAHKLYRHHYSLKDVLHRRRELRRVKSQ